MMFRGLSLWFVLSLFCSIAFADAPTNGLRARLGFDTSQGEPVKFRQEIVTKEGVDGKGVLFDGERNLGTVDLSGDFFKGDFTVSVWFNLYQGFGGKRMIVAKNVYDKGRREWGLMVDDNGKLGVYYNPGRPWEEIHGKTLIKPGHWYQAVLTVSGRTATLYLNGKVEGHRELTGLLTPTTAPLTIGGVDNNGKLMQSFEGVLDDILFYDRALSAGEVAGMFVPVDRVHEDCKLVEIQRLPLWSGGEYPAPEQFHRFKNIRFAKVKPRDPEKDTFKWQHGAAIIRFKDKFYASLGANAGHENTVGEKILITQSDDGLHWTPCRIIGDATATDVGRSHGVFLEQGGKLWSFHSLFKKKGTPGVTGSAFPDLSMEAFVLNEATGDWENKGIVARGIWPLHEPIKMETGNWIVAGCDEDWRGAVAISEGDNLLRWYSTKVRNKDRKFTEANLWVDGPRLTLLIRNDRPSDPTCNHPALAFSNDFGKTWSEPVECDMPMTSSKPACGVLSTGQRFLVNTLFKTWNSRGSLEIAVSRPGEKTLCKVWRIREVREPVPEGAFQPAGFSYPHALEYNGNLYVIYSVGAVGAGGNNNHIELAIIPISELKP